MIWSAADLEPKQRYQLEHGQVLALQRRKRFGKDTVLIVVPTRDHTVAE